MGKTIKNTEIMNEEIQTLKESVEEIKTLRSQNELMGARLDMFDTMTALLHTQVASRNQGMAPDLVYQIEKHIASKDDVLQEHPAFTIDNLDNARG